MRDNILRWGDNLTVILVVAYAVLAAVYLSASFWNKGLYWTGAAVLTYGVLKMS